MFIFVLLSLDLVSCECGFKAGSVQSYDDAMKCLRTIPILPGSDEAAEYITIAKQYLESYAYRDIMLNPPAPHSYQAFDVLAELDALTEAPPSNGFEYVEAIKAIIQQFRDAHCQFVPPCESPFTFVLPFLFKLVPAASGAGDNPPQVVLQRLIYQGHTFPPAEDLEGFVVQSIALDGQTYPDSEPAWETIALWAEQYEWPCRSPNARLSNAAWGYFSLRPLEAYSPPTTGSIKVKLLNPTTEEVIERVFNWYVYVSTEVSNMESLCPRKPSSSHMNGIRNLLQKKDISISRSPEYKWLERNISADVEHFKSIFNFSSQAIKQLSHNELRNAVYGELGRVFREQEEKIERHIKNSYSFPIENITNGFEHRYTQLANDDSSFQQLYSGDGLVTGILTPGNNKETIGYIQINTFNPSNLPECEKHIMQALKQFKANNVPRIALDLCQNGGGRVALSDTLFRTLFPDVFPLYVRRNVVASKLNHLWFTIRHYRGSESDNVEYESPEKQLTVEQIFADPTSLTETGLGTSRTRQWTNSFAWNYDKIDLFEQYTQRTEYFRKRWYQPDDILIVTDGTCGSACSQFVKRAAEHHTAKILGLGSHWMRNDTATQYDIGSFAGGNVVDSAAFENLLVTGGKILEQLLAIENPTPDITAFIAELIDELEAVPSSFPRDSMFRIDVTTAYSTEHTTLDQQLEFKVLPPDVISPSYLTPLFPLKDRLQIIADHESIFNKCFDWQVHVTDECLQKKQQEATKAGTTLPEHTSYGHPCAADGSAFDEDECVLAGCADGYYYKEDGTCAEAKYTWSTYTSNPCNFSLSSVVTVEDALKCMRTLPLNKEGADKETITSILKWLESYASRDVMLNPPSPLGGAVDIIAELQKIDEDTSFTNGYDFHVAIARIINRLQDAHTYYHIPCNSAFTFGLPLVFQLIASADDSIRVFMIPNEEQPKLWENWVASDKVAYLYSVSHISIPGLDDVANEKPEKTLARFAEKLSLRARTPAARLAYFLKRDQYAFTLSYYQPEGNGITVTGKLSKDSEEEVTVEVPFLGVSNLNTTNLDEFCPAKTEPEMQTMKGAAVKENGKKKEEKKEKEDEENEEIGDAIRSMMHDYPLDEYLQHVCKVFLQHPELRSFLHHPHTHDSSRRSNSAEDHDAAFTPRHIQRTIGHSLFNSTARARNFGENAVKEYGASGYFSGVYDPDSSTLYMKLHSFNPQSMQEKILWIADLVSFVDGYVELEGSHFILDMSGNGGGAGDLNSLLYLLLFPEASGIVQSEQTPASAFRTAMLINSIEAGDILSHPAGNSITSLNSLPRSNITWSSPSSSVSRTREWIGPYQHSHLLASTVAALVMSSTHLAEPYYISPQELLITVDGRCGSSCCFFVKHAQEEHLAKVVGFGGNLYDDTAFDSANFCGGPIFDAEWADPEEIPGVPKPLPRDASLQISVGNAKSWDPDTPDDWLEYKIIPVDSEYRLFVNLEHSAPVSTVTSFMRLLLPEFDQCSSWQVKQADCTPATSIANAHYGYPCDDQTHKYDETKCVFARCKAGYYLNSNHACVPAPQPDPRSAAPESSPSKTKTPGWAIALIVVFAVLFVATLVAWIIYCCLCHTPSGKKEKEAYYMES